MPELPLKSEEASPGVSSKGNWSPAQFGLRHLLLFMSLCAILSTGVRIYGGEKLFPMIVGVAVIYLSWGVYRLIHLPRPPSRYDEP